MTSFSVYFVWLGVFCVVTKNILAFPEVGKWEETYYNVTDDRTIRFPKSLYMDSEIFITVGCFSRPSDEKPIQIHWALTYVKCWNNYILSNDELDGNNSRQIGGGGIVSSCKPSIKLDEFRPPPSETRQENPKSPDESQDENPVHKKVPRATSDNSQPVNNTSVPTHHLDDNRPKTTKNAANGVIKAPFDGLYILEVSVGGHTVNISLEVKMVGRHGYLSAVDWPLLPFYGAMCVVYVIFGLVWLAVSFCQWRDLLRVQFWIGAVILLGMLEKATFYAEYQSLNATGKSVRAAVLLAELVSCAKRTLARMLVIIVSLGFGIVKPRLGPALHRVILTGTLYMLLATVESYLRVGQVKDDSAGRQLLLASVPLAVLDSAICWWIFSSLAQTTRTLRLRRNLVKLSLYRHFTNTLIFAVVSSLVFMLYSIRYHRLASCLTDWKALWLDDAYWHLLFSLLLLVIMILWRPGNNNQRYAFSPLLDAPEDEDEDEDDEQFVNDAFGVKMRGMNRSNSPKSPKSTNTAEDDLKWVEENIPSSMPDTALPVLDSDEEIMTTKFEVSKMQ